MDGITVIVTATMSIDGRIALWPNRLLLEPDVGAAWSSLHPPGAWLLLNERQRQLNDRFGPALAILGGSGTFVSEAEPTPPTRYLPIRDWSDDFLPESVWAQAETHKLFVVADSRGRVQWSIKRVDDRDLLVLVSRSTPEAYLARLRAEEIGYLVVGEDRVDFATALRQLRDRLGVSAVVADGGGGLNSVLLRAGLVDELSLIVLPVAIGGRGVPSLFDGEPLLPDELPTRFSLTASEVASGVLWLSYARSATPQSRRATRSAAG